MKKTICIQQELGIQHLSRFDTLLIDDVSI